MVRRNTNQRKIVFDSLEILGHATSEKLIKYINDNYENISLATIYRNLNILESEQLIKKINLDGADIYETVKENHYHFVCTSCKEVFDIDPAKVDTGLNKVAIIDGNVVRSFDLSFYGLCEACRKNKIV